MIKEKKHFEDVEDDLADSDATASESVKEVEELKESEMGSDSDSEYSPDGDAFDCLKDYELEYDESVSASESTESVQSVDDEAD